MYNKSFLFSLALFFLLPPPLHFFGQFIMKERDPVSTIDGDFMDEGRSLSCFIIVENSVF